jgi:hypothetical protein
VGIAVEFQQPELNVLASVGHSAAFKKHHTRPGVYHPLAPMEKFPDRGLESSENGPQLRTATRSPSIDASFDAVARFLDEDEEDTRSLYNVIVGRMLGSLVKSGRTIPSLFLDSIRWCFESMLFEENGRGMHPTDCLTMPFQYRRVLKEHGTEFGPLNYDFTLLLARNLHHFSGTERIRRIKEVTTMIWVAPVNRSIIARNIREYLGMEQFFDAEKSTLMQWFEDSDEICHIHEILRHLAAMQAWYADVSPLWRVAGSQEEIDPHLFETLKAFDWLTRKGATPSQHHTLIDVMCRDIELGPPSGVQRVF